MKYTNSLGKIEKTSNQPVLSLELSKRKRKLVRKEFAAR